MEIILSLVVQSLIFCLLCAYCAKRQCRERLPWVLLAIPFGIVALCILSATYNKADKNVLRKYDILQRWRRDQ